MPHSMAMILTTASIAAMVLAFPDTPPVATVPAPPPPPGPLGHDAGQAFRSSLVFKPYKDIDCRGDPQATYDGQYGLWDGYQMQSYSLSRPLLYYEVLDFYSGIGTDGNINNSVDDSKSSHYSISCLKFDLRAGVNATRDDGTNQGCHTLVHNEWCANIWIDEHAHTDAYQGALVGPP